MGGKVSAIKVTLAFAAVSFGLALLLYIIYRSESIPVVWCAERMGIRGLLMRLSWPQVPDWVIYSLPDGLWLLSYELVLCCFWKFDFSDVRFWVFAAIMPAGAFVYEFSQLFGWAEGTFDVVDLLSYLSALAVSIMYCIIIKNKFYGKAKH